MKHLLARMTVADRLVTALLLATALAGVAWVAAVPRGERVTVSDGTRTLFVAPLAGKRTAELTGPLGVTRLEIAAEGVRIVASPCVLKLCMGMGPARRSGDLLVCLPNRIVAQIEGAAERPAAYDLLSR